MACPNKSQISELGPPTLPFGRSDSKTIESLLRGEDIVYTEETGVYDATDNSYPDGHEKISPLELTVVQNPEQPLFEKKYLWVITSERVLFIKESTLNPLSERGNVCHTNLTGGSEALQGGELYFSEDGTLYINNKSDRYGCYRDGRDKNIQRDAVLKYFRTIYERVFYLY